MSHEKRSRGKQSNDDKLFGHSKAKAKFKDALHDYGFLLTRDYGQKSSVQLVGNRYRLNARQQQALMNMGASQAQIASRRSKSLSIQELKDKTLIVDGFNLIITLESYFSGAYIFEGMDGFFRDISSVHGSYKRIANTTEVIKEVGRFLQGYSQQVMYWVLDKPVSNSGRLKGLIEEIAKENAWNWEAFLDFNPDQYIVSSGHVAISSDAWVLDHAVANFNFSQLYLQEKEAKDNVLRY